MAELYRNNLLMDNTVEIGVEPPAFSFLVITDREGKINASSESFLKGILSACHIAEEKTQIIDSPAEIKLTLEKAIEKYNPSVALIFGDVPRQKGTPQTEPMKKEQWKDASILFCPSLAELQSDRDKKLKLWNFLKEALSIS
jgi:hypothetical protein